MPSEAGDGYIDAIIDSAGSRFSSAPVDIDTAAYLRAYYSACAPDLLRLRSPAELATLALSHRRFAAQARKTGRPLFRVLPPNDDASFAVLETCVDDRPFLVDSVTLSLRAAGATLDLAIHPVLSVRRNAVGELLLVAGTATEAECVAESWIHIEFLPLPKAVDYQTLEVDLAQVLADLRNAVTDYPAMRERVAGLVEQLTDAPSQADAEEFSEARAFLEYLDNRHFTFLGYVPSTVRYDAAGKTQLEVDSVRGLGLLRADSRWASQTLIAPQAELEKYAESPRVIVITKASLASPVHRADLMDVVSVKRFDRNGTIIGIDRFVGLLASEAYSDRPPAIPLVRRKADQVMRRSGLPEASHDGKSLRDILHGLPRDELFQSSDDELFRLCMGIRGFTEGRALRVFMRRDRYGRFYSFLVYLPRDRYSRELRDKLGQTLLAICAGSAVDRTVEFQRGGVARVHYIVRTAPGTIIEASEADVERLLAEAALSWRDRLRQRLLVQDASGALAQRFGDAFPTYYTETFDADEADLDIRYLVRLTATEPLLPRLQIKAADGHSHASGLKLYAYGAPVPLSDVLPTLENFGLRVIRQEPAEITPKGGPSLWVEEFEVEHPGCDLSPADQRAFFEAAFLDVWRGVAENDALNRLVLGAGLDARQVTILRAICKYLIQTGLPFGESYMQSLLAEHAPIARLLALLFENRFRTGLVPEVRSATEQDLERQLAEALDGVASLDGDRVLRAFLGVIRAALRTNGFQHGPEGRPKPYLSIKLDPSKVPELPLPKPMFEIWVYAPEVEGVHLRGSRVARGGLRWSDRRQDFRIEVLGLMKAQMVKNVVIVPSGAKGGFVVKKPIEGGSRDALQKQGIDCYKTFLRGLLDITDNYAGRTIVPPPDVVRYDEDDPYLVVAADKGTATFSDIANEIAAEYGFWLGDAFASGGSAGYDHKKMGITARGAWESVKRHFREMGQDAMQDAFTTVGIGDMSGDVFGNGMLLSRAMRLVAAFDHRHIFLDPQPDPDRSFDERARLFALPRSSWADYDASLISTGGGVFPRSAKQIRLSPQAREALAIVAEAVTPAELMRAILKAPVDLLWNGGIGTYVKAERETALDIGDRANDAIRINGRDLRCKVVGEGGNLGFTQLGRIGYASLGGRINTDAIDNAGGVHTSDREVNIKIPLNQLMREGRLTQAERDPLLAACTREIEQFVLRDNYVQSAAISLMAVNAAARLDDHAELMRILERQGLLNRALEFLPDDETLQDRRSRGLGLTRPEIAVLIAYSKISLDQSLLESEVPDDAFFHRDLLANFPKPLVERFPEAFAHHRLARQIVATVLSNAVVNRMGAGFAQLWADDHGMSVAEVVKAYATAHQIFGGDAWWRSIEAEDNRLPALTQYRLMNYPIGLLKHATGWLTVSAYAQRPVKDAIDRFTAPIADLNRLLPEVLPAAYREDWNQTIAKLRADGVEEPLAVRLANTRALGSALDIVELADEAGVATALAASIYFLVGERFRMLWLYAAINGLQTVGKWQSLARVNLRDDAYQAHRQIAARVLRWSGASAADRLERWMSANDAPLGIATARIGELQATGIRDFATLSVNLRELRAIRAL